MARGVRNFQPLVQATSDKGDESKYWRERAACKEMDPDLWFDGGKVQPGSIAIDPYKICASCPVIKECLTDSIETEGSSGFGIRGGMSANDRRALVRGWRFSNAR